MAVSEAIGWSFVESFVLSENFTTSGSYSRSSRSILSIQWISRSRAKRQKKSKIRAGLSVIRITIKIANDAPTYCYRTTFAWRTKIWCLWSFEWPRLWLKTSRNRPRRACRTSKGPLLIGYRSRRSCFRRYDRTIILKNCSCVYRITMHSNKL